MASGHPKLALSVVEPTGARARVLAIGLPTGLSFSRSALASRRGLDVAGVRVKTVGLKRKRLVIGFRRPPRRVSVIASGRLVTETKALQTAVRKHKSKALRLTVKITQANHKSTTTTLKLKKS